MPESNRGGQDDAGRFAYEGLDRVLHEKARLGIMTSLVSHADGLVFADLKELCSLTDGNLSRHLKVLEEAGLIAIDKDQYANRPRTVCRLTSGGRKRFLEYVDVLESIVSDAARAARKTEARPVKSKPTTGFSPA